MRLRHRWFVLSSTLCALLAGMLLIPGLGGGFVFDDDPNIVHNYAVHMDTLDPIGLAVAALSKEPGGVTRILPTASFALDYWRGGLDAGNFKVTNIAIHVVTVFALVWFFRALLLAASVSAVQARLAAPALALAWAVHPLQVSSVLYVVQRMQTMSTLFLVLALLAYLRARLAQIEGRPGKGCLALSVGLWGLAICCKEDAILFPAYTLSLELTVLRFSAARPDLARRLRRAYAISAAAGVVALAWIVPHFWHWDAYPHRDFSTPERLLTQGRALAMYLWEILVPFPRHMPFYYDWLEPSRSLLRPWTTLPALLLLSGLLFSAWRLRDRRPLFSLGVLLFIGGHFVTSNVIGLELAFEHRNHFPLIGAVLAVGDLLMMGARRVRAPALLRFGTIALVLGLLASATLLRAASWGSPLRLALTSTQLAPHSARAWNLLSRNYFEMGGGYAPGNRYLEDAIEASERGAAAAPYATSNMTNLLIFKTLQGSATKTDWSRYLACLDQVVMGFENQEALRTLINNANHGVAFDEEGIVAAIGIIARRGQLQPGEFAHAGNFILTKTRDPDQAYGYFLRAIKASPPGDPLPRSIIAGLRSQGRGEWADTLESVLHARRTSSRH